MQALILGKKIVMFYDLPQVKLSTELLQSSKEGWKCIIETIFEKYILKLLYYEWQLWAVTLLLI